MKKGPNGLNWNVLYRLKSRPGGRNLKIVGQMLDKVSLGRQNGHLFRHKKSPGKLDFSSFSG
jgi:hypothetical protein